MKEIIENENGEIEVVQQNGNFQIHKKNLWHGFTVEEAVNTGLEKACIMANIDGFSFKDLETIFPYIEPKRLKKLVDELIQDKFLKTEGEA